MKTATLNAPTYDNPRPGCYIDESAGSADMLNERIVELAIAYGWTEAAPVKPDEDDCTDDNDLEDAMGDYSESLNEAADSAVDFLNECETRPYLYWSVDENSLFLAPSVDNAKEDVGFVSVKSLEDARRMDIETDPEDSSQPPADYRGEWLHVTDHGNATLYVRGEDGQDTEIWSVV
jgi:hypothetical protein